MEIVTENNITIVSLQPEDSTFVTMITYDEITKELGVQLKNIGERTFKNVPAKTFIDFFTSESISLYYNNNIKQKFKFMAKKTRVQEDAPELHQEKKNQPKRINRSSPTDFRWINMSINVTKINKAWLRKGKDTGDFYLDLSMRMQPEGEVDAYGKLGMITQSVPAEIYKADKTAKGPILGNAEQLEWKNSFTEEESTLVGDNGGNDDIDDDLPF